jgi:hypothetical protein
LHSKGLVADGSARAASPPPPKSDGGAAATAAAATTAAGGDHQPKPDAADPVASYLDNPEDFEDLINECLG